LSTRTLALSEQKKHAFMMAKGERLIEHAETIAIDLIDVPPVIAEKKLKSLAESIRLGDYTLNAHCSWGACCHKTCFRLW
jgi:hypothetical protein